MKIAIITESLNNKPAGVGNYTFNLFQGLKKIDTKNKIVFINYKKLNYLNTQGYIINNPFKVLRTHLWYPYLAIKLKKYNDIDIVHNPASIPTFFRIKQKNIITICDLTPFLYPKYHKFGKKLIYKTLLPRTLKNADKVIAISQNTKDDLIKFLNIPTGKIQVVYLAANQNYKIISNPEILSQARNKYKLPKRFILHVGTLEPRKNITTLIKAFYRLDKREANKKYKLVLVGQRGWKFKNIFKLVKDLDLENKVIFANYINKKDLPTLYSLADLFVYPSLYEGFGLPILEAMQCGCPVITSNSSSLPEVVGKAGIMIDPLDIDALTKAIINVLTNRNLKNSLIQRGFQQAKKFSWERCARETLKVYQEVYHENIIS